MSRPAAGDDENAPSPDPLVRAWALAREATPQAVREHVATLVRPRADALADAFYSAMMADGETGAMLDHDLVSRRLRASMARWVVALFEPDAPIEALLEAQARTGAVHARVGVPLEWVSRGARTLKRAIAAAVVEGDLPRRRLGEAVSYVHETIDIAIERMDAAHARDSDRLARSDESYRLQFLAQNARAEREHQKSMLLEWANDLLTGYHWAPDTVADTHPPTSFGGSPFGLWLRHKASVLFEDAPEMAAIREHVDAIEDTLLPALAAARSSPQDARPVVSGISSRVNAIKALLGAMFDRHAAVRDGRDDASALLNRRFLPAVVKREIALAQRRRTGFGALVVDLDGVASIDAALGDEVGERLAVQVAGLLADAIRAGDFAFRIGDRRFLLVLVETDEATLLGAAEGLRDRIATARLRGADGAAVSVTASIGAAVFDGHPDYQWLVERADAAARRARDEGGHRVVLAAPVPEPIKDI